jgi:hypothetical protein
MFGFRTDRNRRSSGGNLHSGLLRDTGSRRLCIGECTFPFLVHLVVSSCFGDRSRDIPAEKLPPPPKTVCRVARAYCSLAR